MDLKFKPNITNYNQSIKKIQDYSYDYFKSHNLKSLVLGISGGIDSAIVAAILRPVCDDLKIPLIGRSISISTNTTEEEDRARGIGLSFCNDFEEVDLTDEFLVLQNFDDNEGEIENNHLNSITFKIRMGNIKARMRMMYLYNLASKFNGLVLSTDNYTEYLLGFWTLHGDVGDFSPIQYLWKTEVYELSRVFAASIQSQDYLGSEALLKCVKAVPTDGLGITNSDLDQIGASSYEEVDQILYTYLNDSKLSLDLETNPVIQRMLGSAFKRTNPFNIDLKYII